MNQSGLYYLLVFCCVGYIILVGQRFKIHNNYFQKNNAAAEPVVIITQPPPLFLSHTVVHKNSANNTKNKLLYAPKSRSLKTKQAVQTNGSNNSSSEQISYFVGALAKATEVFLAEQHGFTYQSHSMPHLTKKSGTPLKQTAADIHDNITDTLIERLRQALSALFHVCKKVNAPLLIDRLEARFRLAKLEIPGLLGRCFDCVIARALPRYFTHDGALYSFQHDPYIVEDLITLLQYHYLLPQQQHDQLQQFRQEIRNNSFNKRLSLMIAALRSKDFSTIERIVQPYDPLITLLFQQSV